MISSWTPTTLQIFVEIGPRGSAPHIADVTCDFVYLFFPSLSFPFFLSSPTAKTGGQIFTMYTLNDSDSPKDVPFEGLDDEK